MKYFILGLPRSRTTWLAAYLPNCFHEKSIEFSNLDDLKSWQEEKNCGISDTALILHLEWLQKNIGCPIVIVHRKPEDVLAEVSRIFKITNESWDKVFQQSIKNMHEATNVLHVRFEELDKRMKEICEYIQVPYDADRHQEFQEMNIQPMNDKLLKRAMDNKESYYSLYGEWL